MNTELFDIEGLKKYLNVLVNDRNQMIEKLENPNVSELDKAQSDLVNKIKQHQKNIELQQQLIDKKNKEINDKILLSLKQQKDIEHKKNLVITRNKMLQLSQEQNIYKMKVIYSLTSLIILFVILILAMYVKFNK